MRYKKLFYILAAGCLGMGLTTSCDDMLNLGNDYVIYSGHELTTPSDTVTSVLGILNKLQAISVRTNLLGEVRGDLVDVNSNATTDLKDLADFNVQDDNQYNVPRDYYAVINNCNYFLAYADPEAGNVNRNEKYFLYEIAAVHSIRAWTYLQTVLAYGRIPFVTDPVLTEAQSREDYPMVELDQVCDYFIQDLQPYYGLQYPDYNSVGGDIDPRTCFFPTQVVMGDLYLWRAAKTHSVEDAKRAAKCYYDYIVWDKSGKTTLYSTPHRVSWSPAQLFSKNYANTPKSSISWSTIGVWGSRNNECITAIPMDSASSDGYYNELRNLYNTTDVTELREASISPSPVLRDLSKAQAYTDYDQYRSIVTPAITDFSDMLVSRGYYGDLRYSDAFFKSTYKYNSQEVDMQIMYKHNTQHVRIYSSSQLYLRLAEALNYAGYPRFARQILTMGLSNTVIDSEVKPYYASDEDQEFLSYFDFNPRIFVTYAENYTPVVDTLGVVIDRRVALRGSFADCNMLGIHSRGCGLAFLNTDYIPLCQVDSTDYPYAQASTVGKKPLKTNYEYPTAPKTPTVVKKPSTWDTYGNASVDEETYKAHNSTWYTKNRYSNYVKNDSVAKYNNYLTVTLPQYEQDMATYQSSVDAVNALFNADLEAYNDRLQAYYDAHDSWHAQAYSVPAFISAEQETVRQAILDEQALELAFEGNRFYDLMRNAYWTGDNSVLAGAVAKRNPSLYTILMDRTNWFLRWKGQIGF